MTSSKRYERVLYGAHLLLVLGLWVWVVVDGQALLSGLVGVSFGQLLRERR